MIERNCGEFLTVREIKARYPRHWVLLDNVQSDPAPVSVAAACGSLRRTPMMSMPRRRNSI
jgi:hypothetical protein